MYIYVHDRQRIFLPRQIYKEDPCLVRQTARLPSRVAVMHTNPSPPINLGTSLAVGLAGEYDCLPRCRETQHRRETTRIVDTWTSGTEDRTNQEKHDFIFWVSVE
jgi:hypothetical protein